MKYHYINYDDIFIDPELTEPLTNEEQELYFKKYKEEGDREARDILITRNVRIVFHRVCTRFSLTPFEEKELVSIGLVGLIKSVDSFDISKQIQFITYASRCIDNEILMYMRREKKHNSDASFEDELSFDKNGKALKLEDILSDGTEVSDGYMEELRNSAIREVVDTLPERDKEITILYFGFGDRIYTQKEIADKLNISQSYISRLVVKIVKRIGIELQKRGIIEIAGSNFKINDTAKKNIPNPTTKNIPNKKTIIKNITQPKAIETPKPSNNINQSNIEHQKNNMEGRKNKMGRKKQTIYNLYKEYTKEEINQMLLLLEQDEKDLIRIRYGTDLENPNPSETWDKKYYNKFYRVLMPKMQSKLEEMFGVRKKEEKTKKIENDPQVNNQINPEDNEPQVQKSLPEQKINNDIPTKEVITEPQIVNTPTKDNIEKEDYIKILELFKQPSFIQLTKTMSHKEAIIISLKLGYVNDKNFTTEEVANFLGIEPEEIREITKKFLLTCKEEINNLIDETINYVINQPNILTRKKQD